MRFFYRPLFSELATLAELLCPLASASNARQFAELSEQLCSVLKLKHTQYI